MGLRLLTKKEKTAFFLLCSKQAKINTLIFLIFYCISSILTATGWGLSAVSGPVMGLNMAWLICSTMNSYSQTGFTDGHYGFKARAIAFPTLPPTGSIHFQVRALHWRQLSALRQGG
jgi:hypothetical protein